MVPRNIKGVDVSNRACIAHFCEKKKNTHTHTHTHTHFQNLYIRPIERMVLRDDMLCATKQNRRTAVRIICTTYAFHLSIICNPMGNQRSVGFCIWTLSFLKESTRGVTRSVDSLGAGPSRLPFRCPVAWLGIATNADWLRNILSRGDKVYSHVRVVTRCYAEYNNTRKNIPAWYRVLRTYPILHFILRIECVFHFIFFFFL